MTFFVRIAAIALWLAFAGGAAHAQGGTGTGSAWTVATCPPALGYPAGVLRPLTVNANGEICINGTISASIGGFAPATTGTPISVTTGGVTGTLPAGTVVVATNVGTTNGAYCKLGASATTSDQFISPNGGWFSYTVGANTQLTCITSTSTTTVNMVGGAGLPTGTGGGGGGSGGGGAITIASGAVASGAYSSGSIASGAFASGSIGSGAVASGAVASGAFASGSLAVGSGTDGWDVSTGITTAAAATVGSTGSVNAKLRLMTSQLDTITTAVQGAIPAGTAIIGKVDIDQTTPGTTNGVAIVGVNGATALAGNGATGTGSARMTIANDNTIPTGWPTAANQTSWNAATGAAPPANVAAVGANASGATGGLMAGLVQCDSTAVYDASTSGSTELKALTSGRSIYVCGYSIMSGGTVNVKLIYGTGTACATGSANMTPAYQLTAQAGISDNAPFYRGMKTASANALCINTSAGIAVQAIVYYSVI
jgi:hypothetical protein